MVTASAVFFIVIVLKFVRRFLTEYVPRCLFRLSADEKQIMLDLKEQKNELSQINAQHEFAKYAKLRRSITKNEDEMRNKGLHRQKQRLKVKAVLWVVGMVLTVLCQSWVIWTYKALPLVQLPSQWLSPFNRLLRFPTNIDGAIGLPAWLVISNSVTLQLQQMW